jgi:hypothetical protein
MVEKTRGRPSKAENKASNLVQRVQQLEQAAGRPLPYAQRLYHERRLTMTQLAAAAQVARIYRQWSKQNGQRFNPKSQSFEFTTAGEDGRGIYLAEAVDQPTKARQADIDEQERIDDVNEAWRRLEKCVPVYPREAWAWVIELCVFEASVPWGVLRDVIVVLNRVADEFGIATEVEEALSRDLQPRERRKRGDANGPQFRKPVSTLPAPSMVPALKPTRPRARPKSRNERCDGGEYAASFERGEEDGAPVVVKPAKPLKPASQTGDASAVVDRSREGLERTLGRQAQREKESA